MEEAIGKFMEGMEKQERTGYSALHKLLQGLPVPVQKTAGSASACAEDCRMHDTGKGFRGRFLA